MKYVSLEHSIRSIIESSRQTIKAVARPEDNRKELENVPRENSKDTSAFTRMQEIKNKIIDEDLTIEEVNELISSLNEKKKKKIQGEEPDAPMGTKETSVVVNPQVATEEVVEEIDRKLHGELMAKHDHYIGVESNKPKPDPNVLRDHERAADYHKKALKTNNPHIAADAKKLSDKVLKNEEVEFSEAELKHFNDVLEGRGRPKKSEDNPNTASGRDPRQHIQVIAGQAAAGRNIEFTHNNGDKTTITPSMGRKITNHLGGLKPADRQDAVNKMHASAGGLKLSEDLEQIDEFQGTIKKAATSSSMMSKATAEKGKTQDKQTSNLIKQKQDAQKREFAKRQQTAQTASQRSAIKT